MKRWRFIFPVLIVCLLDNLFAQTLSDNFSMPMWSYTKPYPCPNDDWYNLFKPIKLNEKYRNVKSISVSEGSKSTRYNYCLLYTSPSPRDRTRSRMPSSA